VVRLWLSVIAYKLGNLWLLFLAMVRRIELLPLPAGWGRWPTERIAVTREARTDEVSQEAVEIGPALRFAGCGTPKTDASCGPLKQGKLQARLTVASNGGRLHVVSEAAVHNGKSGLVVGAVVGPSNVRLPALA